MKFLAILYPKSLGNLPIEVGTRYSQQILLWAPKLFAGHVPGILICPDQNAMLRDQSD